MRNSISVSSRWALVMAVALGSAALPLAVQAQCDEPSPVPEAPKEPSQPTKAPEAAPNVTITEKDNGKTLAAKKGDLIEVRLESNATTGFEWNVVENNAELLKPIGKPTFVAPTGEMLGAPGTQVFQFSALKSGL